MAHKPSICTRNRGGFLYDVHLAWLKRAIAANFRLPDTLGGAL